MSQAAEVWAPTASELPQGLCVLPKQGPAPPGSSWDIRADPCPPRALRAPLPLAGDVFGLQTIPTTQPPNWEWAPHPHVGGKVGVPRMCDFVSPQCPCRAQRRRRKGRRFTCTCTSSSSRSGKALGASWPGEGTVLLATCPQMSTSAPSRAGLGFGTSFVLMRVCLQPPKGWFRNLPGLFSPS